MQKWILLLILLPFSLNAFGAKPYLCIGIPKDPTGLFSILNYVAGVLYTYDPHRYLGLEINFGKRGLYFDPSTGLNFWEYYFEPVRLGYTGRGKVKWVDLRDFTHYAYLVELQLKREEVHALINTYIHVKKPFLDKVEAFSKKYFQSFVMGVHYRGTDKGCEAPKVSYAEMVQTIRQAIQTLGIEEFQLFVATDEQPFYEKMVEEFPGRILSYSTLRSSNDSAIHITSSQNYLKGEEALIDCLLLSKSDFLIRTSSNLSLWSTYFNPHLPVIEVNKRYITAVPPKRGT